jgi:nucleotide-binding universal stress UspA family protein
MSTGDSTIQDHIMFKHLLLPTDGSKLSERSVKHGIRLAMALNAKVTALHVVPKFHAFTYKTGMLGDTRSQYEAKSTEHASACLSFVKKVAQGANVECDVIQASSDQPFKEIIKLARKKGCDLILMASHGRRGMEGFLLGSETQKVLTHSQIPVLVYR